MDLDDPSTSAPPADNQNTDPAQNTDQTQNTDANPNPAESPSTSEPDAKTSPAESLSSVVENALKAGKGASSPSDKNLPADPKAKAGQVDPKAAQPGNQDPNAAEIPKEFHKHPAWIRMKGERDEARKEVETYKAAAEDFSIVTGFMDENAIEVNDVVEALQWLAFRNNDPAKFYELVSNFKAELDAEMGLGALPKELQDRVDAGEISEEDARTLQKTQAENKMLKTHRQQTTERNTQKQTQQQIAQLGQQMAKTVNDWEKTVLAKDPDYQAKREMVNTEIRAYIQQYGMPKSAAHALKYATTAYDQVTKRLAALLPQRKPNNPTPQTGRQTDSQFVPKSVEDVVSNILSGGG